MNYASPENVLARKTVSFITATPSVIRFCAALPSVVVKTRGIWTFSAATATKNSLYFCLKRIGCEPARLPGAFASLSKQ